MQKQEKLWTVANILTVMAVAFAVIGFVKQRYGIPAEFEALKIVCLATVHVCFSWRLTKALGRVLDEKARNRPKARVAGALAAFYFGVDVWLVHAGLGWVFDGWKEIALYAASFGFTLVNLAGKWVDQATPDETTAPARPVAPRLPAPPVQSEEIKGLLIGLEEAKARLKGVAA
jgi:hypothetical protein